MKKIVGVLRLIARAVTPNAILSRTSMQIIMFGWLGLTLLVWTNSPWKALPHPLDTLRAFQTLWMKQGLAWEIMTSLKLFAEALAISTVITLIASYLTILPLVRPSVTAITKGRFLGMVGLPFVFTLMFGGGHNLKLALLVFGITVFFITSMSSVVALIPKDNFDHARTVRFGEWRVVWEVVVRGTLSDVFEVLRQTAAIGWMMLPMVEGISRSEGGVGAMLLAQNKYFRLEEVFAIQIAVLVIGVLQDGLIGRLHRWVCPYAFLKLERR